jgi:hypothetical protein
VGLHVVDVGLAAQRRLDPLGHLVGGGERRRRVQLQVHGDVAAAVPGTAVDGDVVRFLDGGFGEGDGEGAGAQVEAVA